MFVSVDIEEATILSVVVEDEAFVSSVAEDAILVNFNAEVDSMVRESLTSTVSDKVPLILLCCRLMPLISVAVSRMSLNGVLVDLVPLGVSVDLKRQ